MRLFQIVALAASALVLFKFIGLVAAGTFDGVAVQQAAAQEQAALAEEKVAEPGEGDKAKDNKAKENADGTAVRELPKSTDGQIGEPGNSRENLLSRLGERRDALDKREQDLALREELLKAAEKSLKAKFAKIEKSENGGGEDGKKSSDRFKGLVVMYESMKPKDAARIFNKLSLNVLYQLSSAIKPRKMSGILAEMEVKAAERLTVEIAARSLGRGNVKKKRPLSKIGG